MATQNRTLTEKEQKRIWSFVDDQTVLNFATSSNDIPWCASCYYAFDKKFKLLIFKTDMDSQHMQEAMAQLHVAGTILPDKAKKGIVKGIQYQGKMVVDNDELMERGKKKYYKKFPFARAMDGSIVVIKLSLAKLTDNKLGFGKRLLWKSEE